MKTKSLFIAFSLCLLTFSNCNNANSTKEEQATEALPVELKDTSVIQADEENALEKLNQVIDTSKKE